MGAQPSTFHCLYWMFEIYAAALSARPSPCSASPKPGISMPAHRTNSTLPFVPAGRRTSFATEMVVARTLERAVKYNGAAFTHDIPIRGDHGIAKKFGDRGQGSPSEVLAVRLDDRVTDDPNVEIVAFLYPLRERQVSQVGREIVGAQIRAPARRDRSASRSKPAGCDKEPGSEGCRALLSRNGVEGATRYPGVMLKGHYRSPSG